MILHTVNKTAAWQNCQQALAEGDQVLLIEDGVYLGMDTEMPLLVLKADAEARGIENRLTPKATLIDHTGFVALSAEADKVVSWF